MKSEGGKDKKGLHGYDFYKSIGSPKYFVAPMINVSDSCYRVLCKRHNADVCFSPMMHAKDFNRTKAYGEKWFSTINGDYPLFLQVAGDNEDGILQCVERCFNIENELLKIGRIKQKNIAAVDLNLGCPQKIARKGNFGAFLMDDQKLVSRILTSLCLSSDVPVTCKIRIFPDFEQTKTYVRMLVNTGISMLTVHGRTRKQMGTGDANMEVIKKVKENVIEIPVIANGSMSSLEDVQTVLKDTKCDGAMVATAMLKDITLFKGGVVNDFENRLARMREYLDIVEDNGLPSDFNNHILKCRTYKFFHEELDKNTQLKKRIGQTQQISDIRNVLDILNKK